MWEVCLPASSSSSSPNSRNRQGRLQLRRERASRWSQLRGRRGGDWSGRQDPDEARDTHTQARRDRHTDTDTFSHSGPTPRVPPTVQGYPDSLSQSCQSPEHSLDTHSDPGLRPQPHPPTNPVGSIQQPEGGEGNRRRKDSRRQRGRGAKTLGTGVSVATLLSQNPLSQDNPGHLARGPASFPHSPNHLHQEGCGVLGEIYSSHWWGGE